MVAIEVIDILGNTYKNDIDEADVELTRELFTTDDGFSGLAALTVVDFFDEVILNPRHIVSVRLMGVAVDE